MKMSLESLASISRKTGFSYFALLGTCSLWGGHALAATPSGPLEITIDVIPSDGTVNGIVNRIPLPSPIKTERGGVPSQSAPSNTNGGNDPYGGGYPSGGSYSSRSGAPPQYTPNADYSRRPTPMRPPQPQQGLRVPVSPPASVPVTAPSPGG